MTPEQKATIDIVIKWLKIRNKFSLRPEDYMRVEQLYADILHSSLLNRLLAGQEEYSEPPPLCMSYPWYGLIEDGKGIGCEVHGIDSKYLVLNQHPWQIVEEIHPNQEYLVKYSSTSPVYKLTKDASIRHPFQWNIFLYE